MTDRGNLKLADGKELVSVLGTDDRFDERIGDEVFKTVSSEELTDVDWTYRIALETQMLMIEGRKLLPGANAGWVDAPLDAACTARSSSCCSASGRPNTTTARTITASGGTPTSSTPSCRRCCSSCTAIANHAELDELAVTMWDLLQDEYDLSDVPETKLDFYGHLVDVALRRAFDRLGELGLVEIIDEARTFGPHDGVERSGGTVRLTPLGLWAIQRMASRLTDAPIVGALRDLSAVELLRAAGDLADEVARGEIDAWTDHHGESAADELCSALPDADETGRGLGFRALLRIGPPAAATVETLRAHTDLADFVTVFRVDTLAASPDDMDRAGDPEGWVRLLHTVIELWGPDAAAAAWAVPAAGDPGVDVMLSMAWRVPGQRTGEVLAAVGGHHPDKRIAKAARKALFKYRSAT